MRSSAARIGTVGAKIGDGVERSPAQFRVRSHRARSRPRSRRCVASSAGRPAHHVGDGLAKTAIGDRAAAMRRGDEDDPAHERQWVKGENVVERFLRFEGRP